MSVIHFGGMDIIITERITKDIQRRKHKKRRINKKYLKDTGINVFLIMTR